jgi:hypothetical protein
MNIHDIEFHRIIFYMNKNKKNLFIKFKLCLKIENILSLAVIFIYIKSLILNIKPAW